MRRFSRVAAVFVLSALISACGGGGGPTGTPGVTDGDTGTPPPITTSGVPTSRPEDSAGESLPRGTLVLTQLNNPVAQTPNQQVIRLTSDRFGAQASPDGRYSVRFSPASNALDLALVDYSTSPATLREVPEGKALSGPGVTWKADSSGFAFFDFPVTNTTARTARTIFYHDIAANTTNRLLPEQPQGKIATSIAFSPDGRYLLYSVGDAAAEGIGGPDSAPFLIDLTNNQSSPLPSEALFGFSQWLRDSSGFLTLRFDPATGFGGVYLYPLNNLNAPTRLTPERASDLLVDTSPDGKRVVVTSTGDQAGPQPVNIYMMNLDGGSRRALTQFTDVEQTITALIWGSDGIYYSLSGGMTSGDTTWRMDLDGQNASQIAQGTLFSIVGAR